MNMAVDLSWWFQQRCWTLFVYQAMKCTNKPVNNHVPVVQLNHVQVCQQPRPSCPTQPCSSLSTTMSQLSSSTMFKSVNNHVLAVQLNHVQACQQPCPSCPAQPCSSLSTTMSQLSSSTVFMCVSRAYSWIVRASHRPSEGCRFNYIRMTVPIISPY